MKLCKCGCGNRLQPRPSDKPYILRSRKYLNGHNMNSKKGTGKGWRINHGYRQCIHRTKDLWKYEHVLVMEKSIGRSLIKGEVVHHKNHNKLDNRLSNLELMTISTHMRHHHPHGIRPMTAQTRRLPRCNKGGRQPHTPTVIGERT